MARFTTSVRHAAAAALVAVAAAAPLAAQDVQLRARAATTAPPPLVIIDGVLFSFSSDAEQKALLQTLNTAIERIEVVKGAAALDRFGETAAGGVIMITLKDGSGVAPGASAARALSATSPAPPLVVLDGVLVSTAEMGLLVPDDIEKIEVIKGPAASRLYGERAAGGVIRITTRRLYHD